ncbi:hypothetical protein B9Z55_014019 [Caenorhabditis nigoni]|uniref:Uncharacterized protein n=1 Tax=Caenorhabditis nigoni TaxID=1611254 RepID=A0A2G5U4C9_9PELO|nr:hypothetical protein B9Z55_014019 [Caenorhabditis nigoni]
MTRKRKNVESDENPPANNGFEGYGYSESKTQKTEEVGTFPNKNNFNRSEERSSDGWRKDYNGFNGGRGRGDGGFRRNDRGGRGRGGKREFDAKDFEKLKIDNLKRKMAKIWLNIDIKKLKTGIKSNTVELVETTISTVSRMVPKRSRELLQMIVTVQMEMGESFQKKSWDI